MSEKIFNKYPQFFMAKILEWKRLFANDAYKGIIISGLQFLANDGRVTIYALLLCLIIFI